MNRNFERRRLCYPANRSRGFSLIELLAAFVVFAIGFGVMMEMTSSSLRNARVGAERTEVALWAQSKLDIAGIDAPIKPGAASGEFDRKYRWEMNVTEWQPPDDAAQLDVAGVAPIELYQIELIVRWGQGDRERHARFVTLRAVQPDQQQG
jgi:general secretion pathway protein I